MAEHSRKDARCADCRGFTMMSTCDSISGSKLGGIGVHRLYTAEIEIEHEEKIFETVESWLRQ